MTTGTALLAALAAYLLSLVAARHSARLWLLGLLPGSLLLMFAAGRVLHSGETFLWRSSFSVGNEAVSVRLDAVGAMFLALIAVVGAAGAVYALEYWSKGEHPKSAAAGRFWWDGLVLTMGLVVVMANGLHFLVAWELFAVCSYFLVTLDRSDRNSREAGWLYLAVSHSGTLALFAFFGGLAAATGSWDLGPMRDRADLAPLYWLALFGFGVKAGVFPLHIWLPSAHANAPSHVSAIMSGVAIKMGIYGLLRFGGWLPVPPAAAWTIAILGGVSAVLGVAFALGQHDLKRLLAYHSVENIGIILLGIGAALVCEQRGEAAWGRLALAGGLLHVWNHGLFKALLFLGAGSVLHSTGTREMSRLGGLWRFMPWTTALFAVGAAAICGLPPLNGFVSEFLIYLGLFDAVGSRGATALPALGGVVLLAVTGALALACFIKVCGIVFLGARREELPRGVHDCGPGMRGAMILLSGLCLGIGLAPVVIWPAVSMASSVWHRGAAVPGGAGPLRSLTVVHGVVAFLGLAAVLILSRFVRGLRTGQPATWGCAYAKPSPRMQYTAGSFAGLITEWFDWILRKERRGDLPEGFLPGESRWEEHTPETVLERIVAPAGRFVLRLASIARRLQHGRLQYYLLYLVGGLILLLFVVAKG